MEGAEWMEGPNRTNQTARRTEPKPKQNPSQKPKRTETNRGFTVYWDNIGVVLGFCWVALSRINQKHHTMTDRCAPNLGS